MRYSEKKDRRREKENGRVGGRKGRKEREEGKRGRKDRKVMVFMQ